MVDAILGVVVEKSISLIQNEFATLSGLRKKAEKLKTTLIQIRAVLEDAEQRQLMKDRGVKVWLQELRDAAHVLDDILDDCSSESFKPTNIMFRYRVGHKLEEMMERLDQVSEAKNKFGLREGVRERPSEVAEWRQTSSIIAGPQVYGRDEDKEKVLQFFLSPTQSSDSLSVYAIVGFGGIGKTTLAQLVYNDERVSSHFDLKIWVCVSENFTRTGILCSIIKSLEGKCHVSDLGVMEQIVQELLRSKRYLLVLDDVWKRNQELDFGLSQHKWIQLKAILSYGSNGSSVLVSTRDMDVATIMGACQTHNLSCLSEDDCWSLFKERAFGTDREERPGLVKIGKEIVNKCGGSPLAAQALGGLMLLRNEEEEWREVLQSELWTLSDEDVIFSALRLSYLHLTPTQKQCFAFCAIFPKDEEIRKKDLIYLWMANGFISSRNNLVAEEVGKMVWNELYRKSFFQDVQIDDLGDDASFKMHDLVHDLAQSIMEKECIYLHETNSIDLSRNTHHIGFCNSSQKSFNKKAFEKVESLRTLYQLDLSNKTSFEWFPTSLRVLRTNFLTSSLLGSLTHLRFLELYGLNIETLPSSIYNLRKLKILKLKNLYNLQSLPKHLTRLKNLRHLAIEYCGELESFPEQGMEGLHSLRSLEIRWCTKLRCLPDGIRHLTSLEALTIDECDKLESFPDQGMEGLRFLRSLFIRTCRGLRCLPDGIRHLTFLEALTIYGCDKLESFPEQGMKGLHSLRSLNISKCRKFRCLPDGIRHLTSLENLTIYGCDEVESFPEQGIENLHSIRSLMIRCRKLRCLPDGIGHLTSLESLTIYGCEELESFPDQGMEGLNSLQSLKIRWCKKLRCLSDGLRHLTSLKALTIYGCDELVSFPEQGMEGLSSLQSLEIILCRKLRCLPDGIRHLTSLYTLTIYGCDELKSFPEQGMHGLRALQSLEINLCRNLRCLPDAIQHLTSLKALTIQFCPTLIERCKKGIGEDWHKIAHIPKVNLFDFE